MVTCSVLWWSCTSIPSVTSTPWWCFHSGMQPRSSLLPSVRLDFYYKPPPNPFFSSPLPATDNGATLCLVHPHVLFIPLHFSELPMLSKTLFWLNTSCCTPIRMVVVCQMVQAELTWQLTDGLAHIVFPDILREMSQALHVSCSLRCLLAVLSAQSLCLE